MTQTIYEALDREPFPSAADAFFLSLRTWCCSWDPLTGLPNRVLVFDRTNQMLARARQNQAPGAALYLDVDGFKQVNDSLEHAAGDELLRVVSARLVAAVREIDTVGRLGGDEFAVIVDQSAGERCRPSS